MLSRYKYILEPKLTWIGRWLGWINPNVLTVLGLVPPVLFFIFMRSGNIYLALAMLPLTVVDMLDGLVARVNNKVTRFGGFLDSTLDRVSDFFIVAGLYTAGLARLDLVAGLLLATFLISYARLRAEAASGNTGITFNIGFMERGERITAITVIVLLYVLFPEAYVSGYMLSEILILLLTVLCLYTVAQRISLAHRKL